MTAHTDAIPFDSAFAQDLHARYAQLREAGPVHRLISDSGLPVWVLTRYSDARAMLTDPRLSKDAQAIFRLILDRFASESERQDSEDGRFAGAGFDMHMLNMDPPDHTRLRKLVVQAFTARRIEALRPRIEQISDELLTAMAGEAEVDFLDAFAFPLPIRVICELLGIDESRRDDFRHWTNQLLDDIDGEASAQAAREMAQYLTELLAAKRQHPADDLLTALIEVSEDEDRLSETELISMVFLLLVAGHETTVNLIGNGVLALLTHPDQFAALRANPELVDGAVEEMLRFDGPLMHATFRFTTEPITVGDTVIPAGEFVWAGLAAANRDPEKFPEPEAFDITRDSHGHLAFGHGVHFCLGAPLARREAQIALRGLLAHFPDLQLATAPENLSRRNSSLIHGLQALPVRLTPRA
ncbi:cytochrome P450 [Saccharopolyspora rhizosphaerae]|uniref:Cytochrome P450 n=1 Tax=Saccharopolyspora rhizosphaerae TaxID=2492662 RepID=A0A3R8P427_9PSEU|nr:cytochrome P450 [Saccharopolyspora rhizosphaerae]RRO16064.1 cytochrome P450 [Saccharopolyspora rhizosphaerae]